MKYLVGHIYDGGAVDELIPFETKKEAENYINNKLNDEKEINIDDWEDIGNNIKIKHYFIAYNTFFIVDLRGVKNGRK